MLTGVVAGRVHEAQPGRVDRLGVAVHGRERRLPALGHGAEALLVDRRQAALLVPPRRVVVDRGVVLAGVRFPPVDHLDQLLAHRARHGAPREQVLGAVDLGRFRQHRRAAVAHQLIRGRPERRVRRDAAVAVRAAAVLGQD
jgi:hypothetical protein